MKLSLLLISLACVPLMAPSCNHGQKDSHTKNESDTLSTMMDTLHNAIDTTVTKMDSLSPSSTDTVMDTLSKSTKYGTPTDKKEAPKHDSPNQEKIDSIKAAKKKKKN